ncbi:hypothetical protein [Clostridium minihomine]|uniref:hypothetical protein n=1 Tax=Clostridium minihomine TaxID=2045012 RepID=UPI000C785051|nr:hypothetical protein [Clostridium minihomine]
MIQHRCPWCGEKIPFHLPIKQLLWKLADPDSCPKCKKPYTSNTGCRSAIILAVGLVGGIFFKTFIKVLKNNIILYWFLVTVGLMILALVFVELCRIPYARDIKKKDRLCVNSKRSANVNLSWEKHEKEGLLLPRFRVLSGEIFLACFMAADGTSISTTFCVVLNDIVWSDNSHCTCKVQFVLDDAPAESFLRERNQFSLYYNYRKIATGTIW